VSPVKYGLGSYIPEDDILQDIYSFAPTSYESKLALFHYKSKILILHSWNKL
jgi:hypothetical protein